jgi:hypothetical protein
MEFSTVTIKTIILCLSSAGVAEYFMKLGSGCTKMMANGSFDEEHVSGWTGG